MKQGTGNSKSGSTKAEPKSKALNPHAVAEIGLQQVRTRPHKDPGRGFTSPAPVSDTRHKAGSQGKR